MATLSGFNAAEVEPATGTAPLPAGDYPAIIVESEMKDTSAGTGRYLSLTFQVLDGQYKNRKLFSNLNLENPSAEAVKIARSELSAICRAVNVLAPKDSVELHNLPLVLSLGLQKRKDTGDMTNRIKAYKPRGAASTPGSAPGAPAPWQKKV